MTPRFTFHLVITSAIDKAGGKGKVEVSVTVVILMSVVFSEISVTVV